MAIIKSAGIFLLNNDFKLLVGHPTNHKPNVWSIPKGKLEGVETPFQAAIRELFEETNVNIDPLTLTSRYAFSEVRYTHGRKKIKPFVILETENDSIDSETFELKCNSYVDKDSSWNAGLPEMDDFKWVTLDEAKEILHYTQVSCIDKIKKLIKVEQYEVQKEG